MPKRKELYEVKDRISGEIVETMAVSEEQAIRNVTYNNDELNYEEYNVIENYTVQKKNPTYKHDTVTVSLSQTDIEKAALKGEPIPKDLPAHDIMLYYMLSGLYARYQTRQLSKADAKKHKQMILNTYQRVKAEYEQFTEICKMYQAKIKQGEI